MIRWTKIWLNHIQLAHFWTPGGRFSWGYHRALDLLFLKEGWLHVALSEQCCFYANHSGVIRNTLAEVKTNLNREPERQKDLEWFGRLFIWSPWLISLITTLVDPLCILLLILTCGPWLINAIMTFIWKRLSIVKLRVWRTHYDSLKNEMESMTWL